MTEQRRARLLGNFDLTEFLLTMLILVFSISVHEFAHAWSAMQLGDRTAYYQGRVTLNPAAHLDPMGTMMMVAAAFIGFGIGWGKPVPVNAYNLKHGPRVGMALTAAAGPLSNILQAIILGIPLRLAINGNWQLPGLLFTVLGTAVFINISLALFNLIPLFPLDGFSVLRGALALIRTRWAYDVSDFLDRIQPYAPLVLLALIFFGRAVLDAILYKPAVQLYHLILGV
jgi:Zn-dependent protease